MQDMRFAMNLSLIVGVIMLVGKLTACFLTHSSAVLSDAAESVVHVIAVAFAAFSLHLSAKPAAPHFLYGYERITFFSAAFEGAMIILAAIGILIAAVDRWLVGLRLENLGIGSLLILVAGLLNASLGYYLLRVGRQTRSLILEADGKHVLTDSWTSFGVVGGLGLVMLTHWKPIDPLVAIAVAINILWSGGHLVWRSAVGLLDHADPPRGDRSVNSLINYAANSACITTECGSETRVTARSLNYTCYFRVPPLWEKHTAWQPWSRSDYQSSWECRPRSLPTSRPWKTMPTSIHASITPGRQDRLNWLSVSLKTTVIRPPGPPG